MGFAALVGAFAIGGASHAASFDCAHAAAPREKLICGDPALSDLDSQLGRAYRDRKALLSPAGAELLQRSELRWFHFTATVCPLSVPADVTDKSALPQNCLSDLYRERLRQLADVGQKIGPFVFNRVDLYTATPADPASDGGAPNFTTVRTAYPQIDTVQSPQVEAWNKQAVATPTADDDGCHIVTDYTVGLASERFVSVKSTGFEYCQGAAHGMGWAQANNVVLQPSPHTLTAQDVFGPGTEWIAKLQSLFWTALATRDQTPPEDGGKEDILAAVIKPDRWLFTQDGIQVAFNSYEGGCYACTPAPVTVKWADLKPLLAAGAVVP